MDYEQDIESDMEDDVVVQPKPRTTTTTTSSVASDTLASSFHTIMDPPSPILPPPPGSISPPRFLREDFDINDDLSLLPGSLMSPPMPPKSTTSSSAAASRSNTVEEDEDEEDEDAQTIISNKLKEGDKAASPPSIHGLDTLTSEMAAKLQSMISEEIEETIPKDEPEDWTSNVLNSPPPPVWPQEDAAPATAADDDEEEEDREDSSGNSQSPKQEHKMSALPPPPEPIPTNCAASDVLANQNSPPPEAEKEEEDEQPTSLPPAPLSSGPTSLDIIPPPQLCSEEIDDEEEEAVVRKVTIQSPPPPPREVQQETAEERELLQKLQDDNGDEEEEDEDDLQVPAGIGTAARELKIESPLPPPQVDVKKQISLDADMDYTKEEDEDDDFAKEVLKATQPPGGDEKKEDLSTMLSVVREDSLPEEDKLEEESEPEDENERFKEPLPNIQEMIPKAISIPEKIAPEIVIPPPKYEPEPPATPPATQAEEEKKKVEEPAPPPKPTTPVETKPPPPQEPVKPVAKDEGPLPVDLRKEEPSLLSKVTSPKGTRLDDFRKPYIPAYQSSLTSSKPSGYTSNLYSSTATTTAQQQQQGGGPVTALNDRNRPVAAMADDRRQRYSSPSSSLREQFFSTSSNTSTTMTSSVGVAPQKPPLTQSGGSSTYSRLESSSSSSTKTETIIQSSSTSHQPSISSSRMQSSQQQQRAQQQPDEGRQARASQPESSSREAKGSTSSAGKAATTPGSKGGDLERALAVVAEGKDSNGGANPGRLPDVSSVVKMTNDVECQSSCSRVVKSGDACSLAFSAIYSKLIIVLGISLPLVEVISPHHIPVLAYQGFYLYLYGVSILFLLFMFFSLCCCRVKPPSSVSPSASSAASQSSETASSSQKTKATKEKKGATTPQTPQEELAQRLELEAQAHQDSNGAGSDLNAATSTTNILTTSPAAGGGTDKKKASVSYASDDERDEYHYGSYFLRLGAIVFGIASILYSGLEFGQFFECKHLILTLTPAVRTLFILLQLYFIFLKNEKITLYPFKLLARVGLMHLIGTNLALWINVLIHETNNEFVDLGPRQNLTAWAEEAMRVSPANWNMSGWNMEWQELMADCPRTNLIGRLVQMISPYLFPCCIQYALICSVILYFMWRNVGQYPAPSIGVLQQNSSSLCRAVDCRQSYRSVLLGVVILGSTIASIVAFFVLAQTEAKLAITQLTMCELALYGITLIAILVGSLRIRKLQYDGGRGFHLDEYLLIGTQIGLFLYSTLAILGTEFTLECQTIFTWVTALLSILQTVCQTMFILDAGRRKSSTMHQIRKGPGREFVVFLLIANLALWIISIFQKSRPIMNPVPMSFYGLWAWTIITHLWSPLAIFYRFQSVVCLTEISKRAYKINPTFM